MVARLYSYELKTKTELWPIRKGLLLEWEGGWGEIAPLPGFSNETLEEAKRELLSCLPNLADASPKCPSVRFGVASAARPLSLEPLDIPLALLNDYRPDFPVLKLKLGHLSVDEAVSHVRKHLGKVRLRLDCNRKWSLEQALSFAAHFSQDDFEYLEEPVDTFQSLLRFSELTRFPVAVDESFTRYPSEEIKTLRALVVKPTMIGHLPSAPFPLVLSSSFESSLGLLQIGRLYQPASPPPGLDTFRFFEEDLLVPPLHSEKGRLVWPGTSGCPIDRRKLCPLA